MDYDGRIDNRWIMMEEDEKGGWMFSIFSANVMFY